MNLVYITGVPGVGKTTVCETLQQTGYRSYDIDRDRLATPVNNRTGEVARNIGNSALWHEEHSWVFKASELEKLSRERSSRIAFICGTVTNDFEFWDNFSQHFALIADQVTVERRLITRTNHDFGKSEAERARVIERMPEKNRLYEEHGAILIDGTLPPRIVVADILTHAVAELNGLVA